LLATQRKDWLALVAVHSDAWLMAVAFYFAAKFDKMERCGARGAPGHACALARRPWPFSRCLRLTSAGGVRRARLFTMLNQLPTVYKALSGDADGKPGGGGGAKKKARAPGSRRQGKGLARFRNAAGPAIPCRRPDAARDTSHALTRPPPCHTPCGDAQQAAAPAPGAKRERTDPEVRVL
jgi:hypothetical protein